MNSKAENIVNNAYTSAGFSISELRIIVPDTTSASAVLCSPTSIAIVNWFLKFSLINFATKKPVVIAKMFKISIGGNKSKSS